MEFATDSKTASSPGKPWMDWIYSYFNNKPLGKTLLVNAENFRWYHDLRQNLEDFTRKPDASHSYAFLSASDPEFRNKRGEPRPELMRSRIKKESRCCLVGLSQYLMLLGPEKLASEIVRFRDLQITGHGVILLYGCQSKLQEQIKADPRLISHILLITDDPISSHQFLPEICLCKNEEEIPSRACKCLNVSDLVHQLDQMGSGQSTETKLYLVTDRTADFFSQNYYKVTESNGLAGMISSRFKDLGETETLFRSSEDQLRWLNSNTSRCDTFEGVVTSHFSWFPQQMDVRRCAQVFAEPNNSHQNYRKWLLWFALRNFPDRIQDPYLALCSKDSSSWEDLIHLIYQKILEIDPSTPIFREYFNSRCEILRLFKDKSSIDNDKELRAYCQNVKVYPLHRAIRYLTSQTEDEQDCALEILNSEESRSMSPHELRSLLEDGFPHLFEYLGSFTFTESNTWIDETDSTNFASISETMVQNTYLSVHEAGKTSASKLSQTEEDESRQAIPLDPLHPWDFFTRYFDMYRIQKLTNHLYDEFLATVQNLAEAPDPKLVQRLNRRTAILNESIRMSGKLKPYFLDALGVEFLPYIQSRCGKLGLDLEVMIGQCSLPSITTCNKQDFEKSFGKDPRTGKPDYVSNGKLDELKHHELEIGHERTSLPKHIFKELEVIDGYLREIRAYLKVAAEGGADPAAVLFSDHGASRLAVLYNRCNDHPRLETEEGEASNSGRCCYWTSDEPRIPCAAYERRIDGKVWAALANYERFKDTRAAWVEVHGGAALEECMVPVIVLRLSPQDRNYHVEPTEIRIRPGRSAEIKIKCTVPMKAPGISIGDHLLKGTVCENDHKQARIEIPHKVLRTVKDAAAIQVYEGDSNTGCTLELKFTRGTRENDLGL